MVHVMLVHFMFFAVLKNSKSSFSDDNMPEHALDIFIENATKKLWFKNWKLFFCVLLRYEMSGKLHLICMKTEGFHAKIRCNLNDISYLSETQKNYFQFL